LKDLAYSQSKMTDSINKKLNAHNKMLENINAKLDEISSVLKNQLSFNKMIETQLAQIAAAIPSYEKDRIPGKPEETMETANLVTTRYDFSKNG
jgi:seryl-tRNA synthetase